MLWNGVIKGQVNDIYSGLGALPFDFWLFCDLRDITKENWMPLMTMSLMSYGLFIMPEAT